MAERETSSKKNQAKEEKTRKSQVENSGAQSQNLMAWDLTSYLIGETPAEPPMQKHIELLSNTNSHTQRANIALKLQQTYGNRYVQRLAESIRVQTKLNVGAADDVYEKEADIRAEQVVNMPMAENKTQNQAVDNSVHRRKSEEETENQTDLQPVSITPLTQRQEEEEEEELQAKFELQGQVDSHDGFKVGNDIERTLESQRGQGSPLPRDVSSFMEPRFGVNFNEVRLHTGSQAADLNRELSAQAFTYGHEIYLGEGKENVQTDEGKRLLAHELTHVVQQTGASPSTKPSSVPRLQLLRSGRIGEVQYNETSEDIISLRMSYQIESFEEILSNIDSVIGGVFGSSGRRYTASPGFESALRSYLQSLNHPAAAGGGPAMSRQRHLSFNIRLIREGRRIQSIEFVPTASGTAAPEAQGSAAPESQGTTEQTTAEPRTGEWESALSDVESPAPTEDTETTEQTPAPPGSEGAASTPSSESRTESGGTAGQVVRGIESYADALSFRFVMNPINAQLTEWEEELERIGGQFQRQPLLGQVLLPTVTHLFVILQSIIGTVDLLLRVNVIVPRAAAALISLRAGLTTPEEFNEQLLGVGEQGLDILLLGLRQAAAHLRQGVLELNVFRLIQAQDEIFLAILALLGMVRGITRGPRVPGGIEAPRPVEAAPGVPAEPAPRLPAEPSPRAPVESTGTTEAGPRTPTGTGEAHAPTQSVEPGSARPAEPARPSRPAESSSQAVEQTGTGEGHAPTQRGEAFEPTQAQEAPRPVEQTGAPEAPRALETSRPASAGEPPPGSFEGLSIEYTVGEVADARLLRDQIMRGERQGRVQQGSTEVVQAEWEGFGGEGPAPPAWLQNDGVLRINRESAGWASPEVQAAYGRQVAHQAEARAAAQAVGSRSVQFPVNDIESVRQMMEDPSQQRLGIERRPNSEAMQRAWEEHGETGQLPDDLVGFVNNEGVLIVNEEALASASEAAPRAPTQSGSRAATGVGEAFESTQAVEPPGTARPAEPARPSRPAEPGNQAVEQTGTGEGHAPTQAQEASRPAEPAAPVEQTGAAETPRPTETARPASAGQPPPGTFNGLSIEYIVQDVADARLMRDQIMRGEMQGRVGFPSEEVLQAEWEGFGGEGPAPPAWMQNDGVLRISRDRVGMASSEVQRAFAERLEAEADARALARPGAPRRISDISEIQRLMEDPNQRVYRQRNGVFMAAAWHRLGMVGRIPMAYMTSEGLLVVDIEALRATEAAPAL